MEKPVKTCIVKDCNNRSDQGVFKGSICRPCHTWISLRGKPGQFQDDNEFVRLLRGKPGQCQAYDNKLVRLSPIIPICRYDGLDHYQDLSVFQPRCLEEGGRLDS